ncbi:hypothetical protein ACHAXS_002002, partial [Conticribra weissflogii]
MTMGYCLSLWSICLRLFAVVIFISLAPAAAILPQTPEPSTASPSTAYPSTAYPSTSYPTSLSPTNTPTSKPTTKPTNTPTAKPFNAQVIPTNKPTVVVQTVRTPGVLSTNKDICALAGAQLLAFTTANLEAIVSVACPGSDTCIAEITTSCSENRALSSSSTTRQLQAQGQTWQLEYIVTDIFTCETTTCSSPSDNARAAAIVDRITANMSSALSTGDYKQILTVKVQQLPDFDVTLVSCFLVWGVVKAAEVKLEVDGSVSGGSGGDSSTRLFYPDWCLNPSGTGLWFVSHETGKCVTDCDVGNGPTCGGFANLFDLHLYSNPRSCCESELIYKNLDYCEADSLLSECYGGSSLFYRGDDAGSTVCVKDCDPTGSDRTCGGLVKESHVKLYETADACCSSEYLWIDVALCAAQSTQTSFGKFWPDKTNSKCLKDFELPTDQLDVQFFDSIADCCTFGIPWSTANDCFIASGMDTEEVETAGTKKFYIDWVKMKCVQDCEGAPPCGGLAEPWNFLFGVSTAC